jgi:TolB-like protein
MHAVNAPHPSPSPGSIDVIAPEDIRQALARLLASQEFCKAQRMRRLIVFLVEKEIAGDMRDTAEYAIGIEVFDRDARQYSTGDDPTVRVQVGRLRERLKVYYGASGVRETIRFSIPIGSYMPVISRDEDPGSGYPGNHLLAVVPLSDFTRHPAGSAFTQGVNEELSYRLFRLFGHRIVSHTFGLPAAAGGRATTGVGVSHLLEGSIRADGDLIRTSLRLIDAGAGCIAWSEQFDHSAPFSIHLQEKLAVAICSGLALYFEQG